MLGFWSQIHVLKMQKLEPIGYIRYLVDFIANSNHETITENIKKTFNEAKLNRRIIYKKQQNCVYEQ